MSKLANRSSQRAYRAFKCGYVCMYTRGSWSVYTLHYFPCMYGRHFWHARYTAIISRSVTWYRVSAGVNFFEKYAIGLPYYDSSAPIARSLASVASSKVPSQSGNASTGAEVSAFCNATKAAYCSAPHLNSCLLPKSLLIGSASLANPRTKRW